MKLLMYALSLSMMLTACGKDNRAELLKRAGVTKPTQPDQELDMSGSYFRLEKKGEMITVKNADGKEEQDAAIEGDIYLVKVIKGDEATTYQIDPVEGTYITIKESVKFKGRSATRVFNGSSCSEFDDTKKSIGDESIEELSVSKKGHMKVGSKLSLRLSEDSMAMILEKLDKEYELADTAEKCKNRPNLLNGNFDEGYTSSALKEFLAN